ncbi:autotransporter domain-containing protein [Shimia sp. R9_3]|uniref:beta strand repeat-containing protein n=1 Tax=Shimia sp. R9_3 TaxID=2821113 RepID=UPI001ADB91CD|nr:autotransporter domain-containing protein [Shimia sp. R9_3]
MEDRTQRFASSGGRMTKWKGQAASLAPSLILGPVSATALMIPAALAETVDSERTAPFVTSVDEDHRITETGAVRVTPLSDNALVEINLTDYTNTLSNQGTIESSNATDGTHAAIAINGTLSGTVANSGNVTLQAAGASSADLRGMDLDLVSGAVSNSGTIAVAADVTSDARAHGISGSEISGSITNSGDISANADGSSAIAAGIYVRDVSGDIENTGNITATANGTGTSATAYGARMIGVSGSFVNSGTIDVSGTAGSEASSYGVRAFDVSGVVTNTGTVHVSAAAGTNPNAYGVDFDTIEAGGVLSNSGTIEVTAAGANGSSGSAGGIEVQSIDGSLSNSGDISVAVSGVSWAYGEGINSSSVSGDLENSGNVIVQTSGMSSASATGVATRFVSGTVTNSGSITARANGSSYAYATGLRTFSVDTSSEVTNSGSIVVEAQGQGSSVTATGMRSIFLSGTLTNSGTLQATASGSTASATGMWTMSADNTARIENSGDITVSVNAVASSAQANGMFVGGMSGALLNSGTVSVQANGQYSEAAGISAGQNEGPFFGLSGDVLNVGVVEVSATGTSEASTFGLNVGSVDGSVTNTGTLSVTAAAEFGGLATGIAVQDVGTAGSITNSGDITVTANYSDATGFYAAGIGSGLMEGSLVNDGTISVTASQPAPSMADAAFVAGIGALEVAGTLDHTGAIEVTSAGGTNSQAYGIYAATLSGQINISGDVAAQGAERTYAIYLGDGNGALNIETSAEIDGTIRVADHDVALTHSGDTRVYQFEDANTVAGTFTTDVNIDNGAWFVSDEGGSAPVYTSAVGEDFAVNTLMPFELSGLSDDLSQELGVQSGGQVSRNATAERVSDMPLSSFARFGYSRSKGTTAMGAERAHLGALTAGLTGQAQDLRYGVGLSFASGNSSQASNNTDTDGVYLSAMLARDFGFADLSIGIGWGAFDHENRRAIAGSADAVGDYDSTLKSAYVGISRAFKLSDRFTLTPRASYLYGEQEIDGYTETGSSANATFGTRDIQFEEAQLGASLSTLLGNGVMSFSLDAVHRSVDSPELVDVSIFGTTTALTAGGSEEGTLGQLGISYQTDLGTRGSLSLSANRRFGSGAQDQYVSAEYSWTF